MRARSDGREIFLCASLLADLPEGTQSSDRRERRTLRRRTSARVWRRALLWSAPPAALVTASAVVSSNVYYDQAEVFTGCIATGILGFASHWVVYRLRRRG